MANILNLITVGEKEIYVVDSIPSDGAGTSAPLGAMAMYDDGGGNGSVYIKIGASDTAWDKISTTAAVGSINNGSAGRLTLYPSTGNTLDDVYLQNSQNIDVQIAAQPTRSVGLQYNFPNPGDSVSSADVILSEGAQSINGVKTFNSAPLLKSGIDVEDPGAGTNKASIVGDTYAANRNFKIPEVGANADFVMTQGAQTIAGNKTFSNNVVVNGDLSVNGSLTYLNSTNTEITDKLITLNKGGTASSAGGSGIEFEEAGSATGYLKIESGRNGFDLKAPNEASILTIDLAQLSANRTLSAPDESGIAVIRGSSDAGVAGQVPVYASGNRVTSYDKMTYATSSGLQLSSTSAPGQTTNIRHDYVILRDTVGNFRTELTTSSLSFTEAASPFNAIYALTSDGSNGYLETFNGALYINAATNIVLGGFAKGVVISDAVGTITSSTVDLSDVDYVGSSILPIANGGTNSSATLNNNRMMISSGGAIVEHSAQTVGQVAFYDVNGLPDGSAALYWDDTNSRLGVGVVSSLSATLTVNGSIKLESMLGPNKFLKVDGSGNVSANQVTLTSDVTGVLPIANGGTNSSTALNNNRMMISSGGAVVEHAALVQGQLMFPDSSGLPDGSADLFWDDTNSRLGIGTNAPARSLDVDGDSIFRSAIRIQDAVATKANFEVKQAEVSTTDATVTTLASVSIPSNSAVMVEARIVGRRTGGTAGSAQDSSVYIRTARFKNVAGTVSILNLQSDYTSEDQPLWNGTLDVSGTSARIRVNGAANTNVDWTVTYFVVSL